METIIFSVLAAYTLIWALCLLAVCRCKRTLPGKLFERIKGQWTNGEYDLVIYFDRVLYEPRIRLLQHKCEKGETEYFFDDYTLRIKGRKAYYHNGEQLIRIAYLRGCGRLSLQPGSLFDKREKFEPQAHNSYGDVWLGKR